MNKVVRVSGGQTVLDLLKVVRVSVVRRVVDLLNKVVRISGGQAVCQSLMNKVVRVSDGQKGCRPPQ